MADVIYKFGEYIDGMIEKNPVRARKLLAAGFKTFGFKLKHLPDKRLPASRRYISTLLNDVVCGAFIDSENSALTSVFLPCELLHAADVSPLCAELFSAFINGAHAEKAFVEAAENEGIAETYCSYHKILLGSAFSNVLPQPGFIINTSLICDANNLSFRALADHYEVPQFYLDVPPYDNEDAISYVAEQLRDMRRFIEEQLGHEIPDIRIEEAVACSKRTIENLLTIQPLRRDKWLATDMASELYELYVTHIGLGTHEALKYTRMLKNDFETAETVSAHAQRMDKKPIRILWVHTMPNWQQPLRQTFNISDDAQIVACDMNFESLLEMESEEPFESMAKRLVKSTYNGSGQRRIDAATDMAKKLNVDGAVVFCHWGCKQTMGLSTEFKVALEDAGFPTLVLNGDGCDESNSSDGQVATRLDAFMEMLRKKG